MTNSEAIILDEAIAHAREVEKDKDNLARTFRGFIDYGNPKCSITSEAEKCQKCSDEHKQLADWLEELKQLREQSDKINEVLRELEKIKCEYDCTSNEFQRGANAGATFIKNKAIDLIKDKLCVKESEENKDVSITD